MFVASLEHFLCTPHCLFSLFNKYLQLVVNKLVLFKKSHTIIVLHSEAPQLCVVASFLLGREDFSHKSCVSRSIFIFPLFLSISLCYLIMTLGNAFPLM